MKNYLMLTAALGLVGCASGGKVGQQNATSRTVASEIPSISMSEARQMVASGREFSIQCRKTEDLANEVGLEFYSLNEKGDPVPTVYNDNYANVALILKESFKYSDAGKSSLNRIIDTAGAKYWITPISIHRIDAKDGKSLITLNDIRYLLYETCYDMRRQKLDATADEWEKQSYQNGFYGSETVRVISAVGPYISLSMSMNGYTGGAHPYAGYMFSAINSDKATPGGESWRSAKTKRATEAFSLVDIAPESEIFKALKADKFLQKKLKGKLTAAKDLNAVITAMSANMNDCDMSVPSNTREALSQLAIFDYQKATGIMAVRVGFSYGCEAMRGNFTQLGLLLKPKESFKALLENEVASAALNGRKPFFMRYAAQLDPK